MSASILATDYSLSIFFFISMVFAHSFSLCQFTKAMLLEFPSLSPMYILPKREELTRLVSLQQGVSVGHCSQDMIFNRFWGNLKITVLDSSADLRSTFG